MTKLIGACWNFAKAHKKDTYVQQDAINLLKPSGNFMYRQV
jgi:hypothetical protein